MQTEVLPHNSQVENDSSYAVTMTEKCSDRWRCIFLWSDLLQGPNTGSKRCSFQWLWRCVTISKQVHVELIRKSLLREVFSCSERIMPVSIHVISRSWHEGVSQPTKEAATHEMLVATASSCADPVTRSSLSKCTILSKSKLFPLRYHHHQHHHQWLLHYLHPVASAYRSDINLLKLNVGQCL